MADKKISQLPLGNLTPETLFPIVSSGVTSQTTLGDLQDAIGMSQDLQSVMTAGSLYFDSLNMKAFNLQGLEEGEQLNILAGRSQLTVGKHGFGILTGKNFITPSSEFVELIANVKEGKELTFSLPTDTKPTGQYTLATLDDITGGSQDLQSVFDVGSFAYKTAPNGNQATFNLEAGEYGTDIILDVNTENQAARISMYNGLLILKDIAGLHNTTVRFEEPVDDSIGAETTLNFPSKPTGQYTLATTDDIPLIGTTAPASSTDTGTVGDIRVAAGFIYWCTAPNTWIRAAGATW